MMLPKKATAKCLPAQGTPPPPEGPLEGFLGLGDNPWPKFRPFFDVARNKAPFRPNYRPEITILIILMTLLRKITPSWWLKIVPHPMPEVHLDIPLVLDIACTRHRTPETPNVLCVRNRNYCFFIFCHMWYVFLCPLLVSSRRHRWPSLPRLFQHFNDCGRPAGQCLQPPPGGGMPPSCSPLL